MRRGGKKSFANYAIDRFRTCTVSTFNSCRVDQAFLVAQQRQRMRKDGSDRDDGRREEAWIWTRRPEPKRILPTRDLVATFASCIPPNRPAISVTGYSMLQCQYHHLHPESQSSIHPIYYTVSRTGGGLNQWRDGLVVGLGHYHGTRKCFHPANEMGSTAPELEHTQLFAMTDAVLVYAAQFRIPSRASRRELCLFRLQIS